MDDSTLAETHAPSTWPTALALLRRCPLSKRMHDYLRAVVTLGNFDPGTPAPISADLIAKEMRVHVGTAKRIRAEAIQDGLIEVAEPGGGRGKAATVAVCWPAIHTLTAGTETVAPSATVSKPERVALETRKGSAGDTERVALGDLNGSAQSLNGSAAALPPHISIRDSIRRDHLSHPREGEESPAEHPTERDDETDAVIRLQPIAMQAIADMTGVNPNRIARADVSRMIQASGGFGGLNGEDERWAGDEPLDRARMIRAAVEVVRVKGIKTPHQAVPYACTVMMRAVGMGEYPVPVEPEKPMTAADRISANKKREREEFAKRCVRLVAESNGQHGG